MSRVSITLLFFLTLVSCGNNGSSGLVVSAQPAQPPPNLDAATLRTQLEQLKTNSKIKSMLATIRVGDQEVLTLALGDSMTNVPATPDMTVRIGGISQTFLGTVLMRLVEKGEISLDDKISKWMPDLLAADKVTVGMLISNTSGYKDYVRDPDFIDLVTAEPLRSFSRQELIDISVKDGELNFEPGSKQEYSHTGYSILANALEGATGRTMPELYQELVLEPLALNNTGYSQNADLPSPVLHAFSTQRDVYEDATFWDPTWTGESGPLYSNIGDLGRWLRLHGTGALLTPESFQKVIERPTGANPTGPYLGFGFIVANGWYAQNPGFNGYSGAYGYLPSQDLTIVIFTTESTEPSSGAQAIQILQALTQTITPTTPLEF
jgi:CubicO group peptidase (beta-lactamase class C family)